MAPPEDAIIRRRYLLFQAAADFFFFQNRSYPRRASLEWVGNRYALTACAREMLNRGVFGQKEAIPRRARRVAGAAWRDGLLVVDGHNVHITVESAILGRTLLLANDGALRDTAGESARFRLSEASEAAMEAIVGLIGKNRPRQVRFLFDAPMSHSGLLADKYRERLKALRIEGEARVVPVPEREIPYGECVTASSDRAVLDASTGWLDLARMTIQSASLARPGEDFTPFASTRVPENYGWADWGPSPAASPESKKRETR